MTRFSSVAALREPPSYYSSIDDLLGDSQTRFFGAGYRLIRRRISEVTLDTRGNTIEATAAIEYPSAWSKKKDRELQPHLSSLDALGIAAQLAEAYLRAAYGLSGAEADLLWIDRCTLKPGPSPTTDLENVPVRCTFLGEESTSESLCGHRSRFAARVGTIAVELTIDHPGAPKRELNARWQNITDILGPSERCYYGAAHTGTKLSLSDIAFEPSGECVRAILDTEPLSSEQRLTGIGAAYYPFVSEMTAIVSVAQLAQALLYRYDNLTREQSNNLWMRKISIANHRPVRATRGLHVKTWSTKMSLLPVKDGVWRTGSFEMIMPGMTAEYTLAHLLPPSIASAEAIREADGRRAMSASSRDNDEGNKA